MNSEDLAQQLAETRRREKEAERQARRDRWRAEHEAYLEARRQERAAEKSQQSAKWEQDHPVTVETEDERFDRQSAERLGMTVEAFHELQEQRRAEMKAVPSLDEQLAALKGPR